MKVKELNELRKKTYNEIIKIEDVADKLKYEEEVYVYSIKEKTKHEIVVLARLTHLHNNFLKDHGFSKNAFVERLYTVNKQLKICY